MILQERALPETPRSVFRNADLAAPSPASGLRGSRGSVTGTGRPTWVTSPAACAAPAPLQPPACAHAVLGLGNPRHLFPQLREVFSITPVTGQGRICLCAIQ